MILLLDIIRYLLDLKMKKHYQMLKAHSLEEYKKDEDYGSVTNLSCRNSETHY